MRGGRSVALKGRELLGINKVGIKGKGNEGEQKNIKDERLKVNNHSDKEKEQ